MDIVHEHPAALVFAVIGIVVFVACVRHHRQVDAVPALEGDRRGEEHGARRARRRDVHRHLHHHRRRGSLRPCRSRCFSRSCWSPRVGSSTSSIAGTLASYLVGDSVFQFSTVIGTYLFAMGIGSFLSRFVRGSLARLFVRIEILIAVVGGFSSSALFLAFAFTQGSSCSVLDRVRRRHARRPRDPAADAPREGPLPVSDAVSHVLTFDYLGALVASLLFPLVLVPQLGLVRSAMLFGVVNAAVALWSTRLFAEQLVRPRRLQVACVAAIAVLSAGVCRRLADQRVRRGQHLRRRDHPLPDTPYQHIVLTAWKDDLRLFLNAHLQFSSRDEYRYHEALVHPGLAALPARDACWCSAAATVSRSARSSSTRGRAIMLVDLDPEMTRLFSPSRAHATERWLAPLAQGAGGQCRRVPLARLGVRRSSTSSSSIFPIRRTSHSASCTRPFSSGARAPSPRGGRSSCRAPRRCSRASRSGASTRPSSRWLADVSVPRLRAVVWRVGIRPGSRGIHSADGLARRTALPRGRHAAQPVRLSSDMARVSMPANQLNDQALVRTSRPNGGHQPLTSSRREFCFRRRPRLSA